MRDKSNFTNTMNNFEAAASLNTPTQISLKTPTLNKNWQFYSKKDKDNS